MARVTTPRNSLCGPEILRAKTIACDEEKRLGTTSTASSSVGSLANFAKYARSAILISGTGQTRDELIRLPLESNTLEPATSAQPSSLALNTSWTARVLISPLNISGD